MGVKYETDTVEWICHLLVLVLVEVLKHGCKFFERGLLWLLPERVDSDCFHPEEMVTWS